MPTGIAVAKSLVQPAGSHESMPSSSRTPSGPSAIDSGGTPRRSTPPARNLPFACTRPTFSSSVRRPSRSSTRASRDRAGSRYSGAGGVAATASAPSSAIPARPVRTPLSLHRLAVHDPAAACSNVDAAVHARVADDHGAEAVLVLVVVDPHPFGAGVVGAEEARHVADLANEIQRRIRLARGRLAEAEGIRLRHTRDR